MYSYEDINSRSASKSELVVNYTDVMELLHIYEKASTPITGWQGWLVLENGSITLSQRHRGRSDLSSLPLPSAISFARSSIMQAYTEHEEISELVGAELYFSLKANAQQFVQVDVSK